MPHAQPAQIAVIGGGPAGLMAAEIAALGGARVTLYDHMPSVGRKFLLAGRGGLNLTHSEPLETLLHRYGAAEPRLRAAIEAFPPDTLRAWSGALGQPTFIGTSGRVFPQAMKASPLLRAWLRRLGSLGVTLKARHRWEGWSADGQLRFTTPEGPALARADAAILALGGASWARLGSDGAWVAPLTEAGVEVAPLQPANCGFTVAWSDLFRERFHGQPLKGISLSFGERSLRSEALITRSGVQGGGVYALSGVLRDAINASGVATLLIDLRPNLTAEELERRLHQTRGKQSLSTFLRKAVKLSAAEIGLLQEAALLHQPERTLPPEPGRIDAEQDASASAHEQSEAAGVSGAQGRLAAMRPRTLAAFIKAVPVRLTATTPIDKAISTAGGIAFDAMDEAFMLRARPGTFAAGEMLDWEAPTGGYLLQACFATGAAAARGALAWVAKA